MYANLRSAMKAKNITNKDLAAFLVVAEKTVSNKLNGRNEWSYGEVVKIKRFLFPEYDTDWLFFVTDVPIKEKTA